MTHFAKVENGTVTQVIVAEQDFINTGHLGDPSSWIQTSYNTRGGVHLNGGTPLRKNFAGIGYSYNADLDAFIPPKIAESWIIDEDTGQWRAPIDYPTDGEEYSWNEETLSWDPVIIEVVTEDSTPTDTVPEEN
jgi:hypothetical protein